MAFSAEQEEIITYRPLVILQREYKASTMKLLTNPYISCPMQFFHNVV